MECERNTRNENKYEIVYPTTLWFYLQNDQSVDPVFSILNCGFFLGPWLLHAHEARTRGVDPVKHLTARLSAQNQNLSLNMLNSPESQFQHLEIVLPGKMCETHSSSFPEEWWSASHWLSETGPNRGTPSVTLTGTRFSLLWDSPNMVSKHNLHIWSYMHTWAHI